MKSSIIRVIPKAFHVHGVAGPLPGTGHTCTTRQPAIEFQLCLPVDGQSSSRDSPLASTALSSESQYSGSHITI